MKNKKLFAILTLVCFMMTLMPVAAFADDTATVADMSMMYKTSTETVVSTGTAVDFTFSARDNAGDKVSAADGNIYIWAKDAEGNITSALNLVSPASASGVKAPQYAQVVKANGADTAIKVSFARDGVFKVYAAYSATEVTKVSDLTPAKGAGEDAITVLGETANPDKYTMSVNNGADKGNENDDYDWKIADLTPNNVSKEYTLHFENNNKALTGKTVTIETDSDNIAVNKTTATTNYNGDVKIELSASREGSYSIYVNIEGKEFVILVDCTNTSAAYIETSTQPENLIAQFTTASEFASAKEESVVFTITDINGNLVKDADTKGNGADGIFGLAPERKTKTKYLFFTEKPASSALTNAKLSLKNIGNGEYALLLGGTLDAEGVYTVKAILDNGSVATATWEVKRFQTPVELRINVASTVELGKSLTPSLKYVDVNGVVKKATDAKLAATGYAIYSFNGKNITLKTDEKYAGEKITLTAVSERYDLVATKEVKIAAEAKDIKFTDKNLAVNVNNKVVWNVVDEEGNNVKLNDIADYKIRYVVLDKPEDAKVSVYDLTTDFDGDGKMALTSNKVGNVTVQAVAQVQFSQKVTADADQKTNDAVQTKYYTGTQIFAVGTEGVGDVVVMSIGSHEIVVNDKTATIDAAPMIQNDRTFVPFRALAEAFGAEVAYDEATQAVTAKLNGVEVVMTIGSATYTVNGTEKTADVAPFINGSRTMVPVRFAAEAFGIKVIPTYNPDGTTADILFNL